MANKFTGGGEGGGTSSFGTFGPSFLSCHHFRFVYYCNEEDIKVVLSSPFGLIMALAQCFATLLVKKLKGFGVRIIADLR